MKPRTSGTTGKAKTNIWVDRKLQQTETRIVAAKKRAQQSEEAIAALDHLWLTLYADQRLPPAIPMLWWGSSANPVCYLDIGVGPRMVGRLLIQLFANLVPRAAENFRGLCTKEYDGKSYEGQQFDHVTARLGGADPVLSVPVARTQPRFICEGGAPLFAGKNESIYGGAFEDETFDGPAGCYSSPGVVAMSSTGPHSNRARFFITFISTPWLHGRNVIVGRVHPSCYPVLRSIEKVGTLHGQPEEPVTILASGQIP